VCLTFSCTTDEECASGFCGKNKICCTSPCNDICTYCRPWSGECWYLPPFWDDYECGGTHTCNGGGYCALRGGEPCFSDADCASLVCKDGKCTGPFDTLKGPDREAPGPM
jgi:hypothetical protein